MRSPRPRCWLGIWSLGLVLLAGCPLSGSPPPRDSSAEPSSDESPLASEPAPAILSARLSRVDDPELDGRDGVLVVFDLEVDAASLDPRAFVVSRATTGPVRPEMAVLAPANEDDENRSVMLVGDFGDATPQGQPTHVAVSGPLFSEGRRLSGLGASIEAFELPPRIVALTAMTPAARRCEGAGALVRTYWSDDLRGVEPDDLARIRVELDEGSVHPLRFDDHSTEHGEASQDNVLDLCLADGAPARRVRVEAGAFQDAAGHGSAAADLEIANSASPS